MESTHQTREITYLYFLDNCCLCHMYCTVLYCRGQLVKEKGKNKMLMQRMKEGQNKDEIVWATGTRCI